VPRVAHTPPGTTLIDTAMTAKTSGSPDIARVCALALAVAAARTVACDCFPPELRIRTAQETLLLAKVAVYGRVADVTPGGKARVLVLESFKGPVVGSTVEAAPDRAQCPGAAFVAGEEVLVLSFQDAATACDKRPPDHYLVETFRWIAVQSK
jgi:hypothetical protein